MSIPIITSTTYQCKNIGVDGGQIVQTTTILTGTRESNTSISLYDGPTLLSNVATADSGSIPTWPWAWGAIAIGASSVIFQGVAPFAYGSLGSKLTQAQITAMTAAIQVFQTAVGRVRS